MAAVKPIPDDYPQVIAYLCVDGAAQALDWYCDVFGATERMRMEGPPGRIGHAEIEIGDSLIMLADEFPDMDVFSPKKYGGTPVMLMVYTEDVDATFKKAVDKGAKALEEPVDKFYGDRNGTLIDPFGHKWSIATHVEDVSAEEMERRAAQTSG
jgi:PhnB protein